jgi:GT2 family glycosyltransferase
MDDSVAVAILTYNRSGALLRCLDSVLAMTHCPVAVFEDAGIDDTAKILGFSESLPFDTRYDAYRSTNEKYGRDVTLFFGRANLGVAKNTNRALHWFMNETKAKVLVICNDDVLALGDFASFYRDALARTGLGLACFCDLPDDMYQGSILPYRGYRLLLKPRIVGMAMAYTRYLVNTVGYYDARFPQYGNEHCEYNNRARMGGFLDVYGVAETCLDIANKHLTHQTVACSVDPKAAAVSHREADKLMQQIADEYGYRGLYRPYALHGVEYAEGCKIDDMPAYAVV